MFCNYTHLIYLLAYDQVISVCHAIIMSQCECHNVFFFNFQNSNYVRMTIIRKI